MEKQTEKIMRFSRVVCILLSIAIVVSIVICVFIVLTWILSGANLPTETVTINGVETEVAYLFKLGETTVYLPVMWESGFDFSGILALINGSGLAVGIGDLLGVLFTIIGLRFAKKVFLLLRENGSPFRDEIVHALRRLAIVLLVVGCVSGIVAFLAAGIVWVLCLIFDYGRILQNESDTTL